MSRLSLSGHPFLLGFDQVERLLERAAKGGSDGYPPYNIEIRKAAGSADGLYRITLAVAGFADEDLEVTIEDGNLLVIRGRASSETADDAGEERVFLHRGIAARQFQKSFVLAEGVEVVEARLSRGLLHVDLARREIESPSRRISIERG